MSLVKDVIHSTYGLLCETQEIRILNLFLLEVKTLIKLPERVERISNKKCGESPADFSHIFYGPVQGRL